MSTHTIDFRLNGTLVVKDFSGSCSADDGIVYAHVGAHYGTYRWQALDTLLMVIDGQALTYTVKEDSWILRVKHVTPDHYAGDYLRGDPGVSPCLS